MIATPRSRSQGRRRRRGFSLVETMVACVMSVILISILVAMTATFERGAAEVVARCDLAREADLAMARIADDLRGLNSARPETRTLFFVPDELQVIFSDRTIFYTVQDGDLVRSVEPATEAAAIVAHHVQHLEVQRIDPEGPLFEVSLSFTLPFLENRANHRVLERSFHLIAVLP